MKKIFAHMRNFLILSILLPYIYGCGSGGGGLGGFLGGGGGSFAGDGGGGGSGSGGIVTVGHTPEPTTILLMGSGLAAMALYRKGKQ